METAQISFERGIRHPAPRQLRPWLRWLTMFVTCLGLVSCGSGGGGGDASVGALRVTVSDSLGGKVPGATVKVIVGSATTTATTGSEGVALPISRTFGAASVVVSRASFVSKTVSAVVTANTTTDVDVTLDRVTSAAGGSLPHGTQTIVAGGKTMTFEIAVVVVGGDAEPITVLGASNFTLLPCAPDAGNANGKVDCVYRADAVGSDAPYQPTTSSPLELALLPAATAVPYAAGLMLDQSTSIATNDPTGARLYSAKAFLNNLGDNDRVLLGAFADGAAAKIPDKPLTVYRPFRFKTDLSMAPAYVPTLDSLANQVGGNTLLYDALDLMMNEMVSETNAKAIVMFTDGDDTACGADASCRTRRKASIDKATAPGMNLRVFTIGLSNTVNTAALTELSSRTGGAFLSATSVEQLIPLYGSVGRLLSGSLPKYRLKWTVVADSTEEVFKSNNILMGTVRVNAGASTFDVPFSVYISIP